ncbi:54S ribosomal protein img2, mitochondrial [Cladophialophora carrionii]|uniref:Large ribosomal subunit protein mL49 n=1 Tax=Cladophialophora carrionii TaxID=86049 RepID=A0A1C1CWB8_9EURO|nr:54S ribosomal protein img2, mitochondrial [Cladophialophora carrionii]
MTTTGQDSEDRAAKMYPDTDPSTPSPTVLAGDLKASSLKSRIRDFSIGPTLSSLPYSILRTPSKNLPIYQTTKSGGSKHITTIRKIQGDLTELATAVRQALGMEEYMTDPRGRKKANVVINRTTKHVIIRGWRGAEIKRWAEVSGF